MQLFPGAKVVVHWLVTAKGGAAVSPEIMTLIFELLELVFLIVSFLGLLALPTVSLVPKATELGLIVIVPGSDVGVEVGVAVRVAVALAVAVAVAVAVLVAVAVGVADPPDVGVAVGVGVGVPPPLDVAVGVAEAVGVAVGLDIFTATG